MDQEILVKAGHLIVGELENEKAPPRAALWVHATDTDNWKLWILPHKSITDNREFYRRIASIVSKNRSSLGGIDAADIEIVSDNNPVIKVMRNTRAFKVTGRSTVDVRDSTFNGYYLAHAIILHMDL
jgi:hypothetical protein